MADNDVERSEAAIGWAMRMRDPSFADWDAFTAWLERDPANAAAYDEVMLAAEDADAVMRQVPTPAAFPARRWRIPAAMTAAAALAGIFTYSLLPSQSFTAVSTAAREQRSIRLRDGTRIDLNGGTEIAVGGGADRLVRLERGEATFSVVHDAAHPLVVQLGDKRLQDVGTVFNVVRTNNVTSVAVAEGAVVYDPEGQAVQLNAGQKLEASAERMAIGRADPAAVGSWRRGQLIYDGGTIGQVAADMARNIGVPIQVDRQLVPRGFSGVILLDGDARTVIHRAASLLDVTADRDGNGWHLHARTRAKP